MAYRGDDAGDALEAPTTEGMLRVSLGPNRLDLSVAARSLHIVDRVATIVEHKRQKQERRASLKITGQLVFARGVPREDLGVWVELDDATKTVPAGMKRVFGVQPVNPLDDGLLALGRLDTLAKRLRGALVDLAPDISRGIEIGTGHPLDKVLVVDRGSHYIIYARRLFRDRARFAFAAHDDGRIVYPAGRTLKVVEVRSRFGVRVRGDYIQFADRHGTDVARISLPWIGPEDRDELAKRIGALVHRD